MRRIEPYIEPVRRRWTRDELRAAVQAVRAMAADEVAGRDPRRTERIAELATELGRERQAVRMRLNNIVYVLADAGLPTPSCLPALPGVGRLIATTMLDVWHALDAEEDMATSKPVAVPVRRPWTTEELADALSAVRGMSTQEAKLGRSLDADDAGDRVCEVAFQLGRRWSETRHIMAAIGAITGTSGESGPRCLQDVDPAVLEDAEATALERLRRGREGKEG